MSEGVDVSEVVSALFKVNDKCLEVLNDLAEIKTVHLSDTAADCKQVAARHLRQALGSIGNTIFWIEIENDLNEDIDSRYVMSS